MEEGVLLLLMPVPGPRARLFSHSRFTVGQCFVGAGFSHYSRYEAEMAHIRQGGVMLAITRFTVGRCTHGGDSCQLCADHRAIP